MPTAGVTADRDSPSYLFHNDLGAPPSPSHTRFFSDYLHVTLKIPSKVEYNDSCQKLSTFHCKSSAELRLGPGRGTSTVHSAPLLSRGRGRHRTSTSPKGRLAGPAGPGSGVLSKPSTPGSLSSTLCLAPHISQQLIAGRSCNP